MKTARLKVASLVGVVVGAHLLAGALVMLIQGCGTAGRMGEPPPAVMPPTLEETSARVPLPSESAFAPPMRSWEEETSTYVVKKGDVLSAIAKRHGMRVGDIVALNGLKSPDRLSIGQTLKLPARREPAAPPPAGRAAEGGGRSTAAVPGAVHLVKAGDTLSELAKRYDTTVAALKKANGLDSHVIYVGQKLALPSGAGGLTDRAVAAPRTEGPPPSTATAARPEPKPPLRRRPRVALPEPEVPSIVAPAPVPAPPEVTAPSPPEPPPPAAATTRERPPAPSGGAYRVHVVEPEEDLYAVSLMWGVGIRDIRELNNLSPDARLKPGQRLKIPMSSD